jgi:chromosome segregation ATPase
MDLSTLVDPAVLIALLTLLGLIARIWLSQMKMKEKQAQDAVELQRKTAEAAEKLQQQAILDAREVSERLELALEKAQEEASAELKDSLSTMRQKIQDYANQLALYERERVVLSENVALLKRLMEMRDKRVSELEENESRLQERVAELERRLKVYEPNYSSPT